MHIDRITLAVEDIDLMVGFYNEVFDCGLEPISRSPLAKGTLAGIELVLCPNSIAEVVADQNRHQLRIGVDDAEALALRVEQAGGSVLNRSADGSKIVGISDPEGNTYEIIGSFARTG
jgi:predicted enzyme related to lactoylglutathione lyase